MGCFDQLRIPWDDPRDLEGEGVGRRLAENFREIDRWANPLEISDDCMSSAPCVYLMSNSDTSVDGEIDFSLDTVTLPVGGRIALSAFITIEASTDGVVYSVTSSNLDAFVGTTSQATGNGGDLCIPWSGVVDNLTDAEITLTIHLNITSDDDSDFFTRVVMTGIVGQSCNSYYNPAG